MAFPVQSGLILRAEPRAVKNKSRFQGALPAAPFLVALEKNQAINRLFIETGGFYAWAALFARSKYELLENFLDWAGWCVVGLMVPITLGKVMRGQYTAKIAAQFAKHLPRQANKALSILEVPFELLDKVHSFKVDYQRIQPIAKALGFKDSKHLETVLKQHPYLVKQIRHGKINILTLDLVCMGLKGQLFNWGSKWLTAKLSGRAGFSGEFSYATDDYLKKKSQTFSAGRRQKQIFSLCLGVVGALSLPVLTRLMLSSSIRVGQGLLGKFKGILPAFNYVDAIYMSKWVLLWHNIFNYTTPALLSVRDLHEFREKATKVFAFDGFYFFGDDILIGLAARYLQHKNKHLLKGISLLKETPGIFGLPKAKRLSELYELVAHDTSHLAYKLGIKSFLFGFLGTTLGLGIATNLANNLYTHKKVMEEQKQLGLLQPSKPPEPQQPASGTIPTHSLPIAAAHFVSPWPNNVPIYPAYARPYIAYPRYVMPYPPMMPRQYYYYPSERMPATQPYPYRMPPYAFIQG